MAFDQLLVGVIDWEPCTVGTSTKTTTYGSSVAHHIRIAGPDQVDDNLLELLQQAFMQS